MAPLRDELDSKVLRTALAELRLPTHPDPGLVDRIMDEVGQTPGPQCATPLRRGTRVRSLALAASLAAIIGTGAAWAWARAPRVEPLQSVRFQVRAAGASVVSVVGDFNDWKDQFTPLGYGGDGIWSAEVALPAGRYEYAFRVDGEWRPDDVAPYGAANEFGAANSVLIVGEASQ